MLLDIMVSRHYFPTLFFCNGQVRTRTSWPWFLGGTWWGGYRGRSIAIGSAFPWNHTHRSIVNCMENRIIWFKLDQNETVSISLCEEVNSHYNTHTNDDMQIMRESAFHKQNICFQIKKKSSKKKSNTNKHLYIHIYFFPIKWILREHTTVASGRFLCKQFLHLYVFW